MIASSDQALRDSLVKGSQPKQVCSPLALAEVFGGALLAGVGLVRGGPVGLLAAGLGGFMVYHGLTTTTPIAASGQGHHPHHPHQPDPTVAKSTVDEAAWESFPASDPPAYGP